MEIKKELITRSIAGDTVLVPVGKAVYDSNGLFVLNEVGAFLWNLLPQAADSEALLLALLEEYDVSPQQARRDIDDFLAKLRELGIL